MRPEMSVRTEERLRMSEMTDGGILVVGAAGGVGRQMCAEVTRQMGSESLVLGDYRLERAEAQALAYPGATSRRVDLRDPSSIRDALDCRPSAVIVCALQEEPTVQVACLERGVACLDVTIEHEFIEQIHELDQPARDAGTPLLSMAGMWPGLSGLMAARVVEMLDRVDTLDLALCQSTASSVGPAGLGDMMGTFSRPVCLRDGTATRQVPGFSIARRILYPKPFGTLNHRLVDFVEGPFLSDALKVPEVHLWTGFDSAAFDRLISFLRWTGALGLFRRKGSGLRLARAVNALKELGPSRGPETIAVVVSACGEREGRPTQARVSLRGPSDYGVTAMAAVAFARLLAAQGSDAAGAGHPMRLFRLHEVIETTDHPEIEILEFGAEPAAAR